MVADIPQLNHLEADSGSFNTITITTDAQHPDNSGKASAIPAAIGGVVTVSPFSTTRCPSDPAHRDGPAPVRHVNVTPQEPPSAALVLQQFQDLLSARVKDRSPPQVPNLRPAKPRLLP